MAQKTSRGASTYWAVLKNRLSAEGADELLTNCKRLRMRATDGKMRITDAADTEQMFRIIQSIPSKKAEPFKRWMASVAKLRLDQMADPELSINQAMLDWRNMTRTCPSSYMKPSQKRLTKIDFNVKRSEGGIRHRHIGLWLSIIY